MNFYKHYIGDFQRDTGHLSLTERGAYLALMHHYYATEKPLPKDHAALCRIAGAVTKAEQQAVRAIMCFFTEVESGLMHNRIEAELEKAGNVSSKNREIALAREANRRAARQTRIEHDQSTLRAQSVTRIEHDQSTNQTPDTNKEKHSSASADFVPRRFDDFWNSWPRSSRKTAKSECLKRWKARRLDSVAEQILSHVAAMSQTKQWQDGFEPAPLTYLNQRRWEDELPGVDLHHSSEPWANAI